jgi:hypothetical protein
VEPVYEVCSPTVTQELIRRDLGVSLGGLTLILDNDIGETQTEVTAANMVKKVLLQIYQIRRMTTIRCTVQRVNQQ